ncbi:MAG: hypothetical protein WC342_02645 [Methanoregula sp.]|jgi:hypothetical protein
MEQNTKHDQPSTSATCVLTPAADRLQKFFIRPFFLSLTIGIPFCIFKGLFGLAAFRAGIASSGTALIMFGAFVLAWATTDLLMNIWRSLSDLVGHPAGIEYCSIAQLGKLAHRPMIFLAIDTLLSFGIICLMLWSGWIATLTVTEAYLWYAATTLNLISLSVVSLYNEMKKTETFT